MNRLTLTNFSIRFPWIILLAVAVISVFFGAQFPKVHFDNDPENMLSKDEHVRAFHHQIKEKFSLYDFVIIGIVNEENPDGIFNTTTLRNIDTLTQQLLSLRRDAEGIPEVATDASRSEWRKLNLTPPSAFKRALAVAFRHDPYRLFDEEGNSAMIGNELISPSVVDNIKQAEFGSLKLEYLMEHVPATRAEAMVLRDDAMSNPLYKGTLVAEDGKAICIYIPIVAKSYSYNVANLVRELTRDWPAGDQVHISGLPVAEDTFGIEMLVQMAVSAPLAMLILFILMYVFFRRVSLIIAPLLLAVVASIWSMGLLIGLGYDVHIMSSMIPIFIMPITVCDSIHLLSEFFDSYYRFNDKRQTLRHVIGELFMPMLYTSATTIAGFASLATTPIPPVRVFGLHVAFGVAVAWVLTMTLVPAYIVMFISDKKLRVLCAAPLRKNECDVHPSLLGRLLHSLGGATYRRYKWIVTITLLVLAGSIYGITLIRVNDNPVKWFAKNHEIRVADKVLNQHFGGTYTAYLTFTAAAEDVKTCREKVALMRRLATQRFEEARPQGTIAFLREMTRLEQNLCNANTSDPRKCFVELAQATETIDRDAGASWANLADAINYLDSAGLTIAALLQSVDALTDVDAADKTVFKRRMEHSAAQGSALLDAALIVCDEYTALSFREFVFEMEAELTAPAFKQPATLRWLETLQAHLVGIDVVGKTSSAVDALKKAGYELKYTAPPADAAADELAAFAVRNRANFSVPNSAAEAGQVYIQLEGMKKKNTIFHLVSRDYQEANIWVQLKSGDNRDMKAVVDDVKAFIAANPPPVKMETGWAGLTYLNVVWQEKMVVGMFSSLASSFVVVLIMMLLLFRSGWFGTLAMIPLTVTISFIYGMIGIAGKDYDMPVAILSAMTLGLSVDFAIHFLERSREMYRRTGNWQEANARMFDEPARAISRNAIVIAIGFLPLLLAPLVPYRTVGFFLAMIMLVSWLSTLLILPALMRLLQKQIFKNVAKEELVSGDNQ